MTAPIAANSKRVIPIATEDSSVVASLYQADAKIFARSVSGWFNRWRWAMVFATQAVFYGIPWLSINGRQLLLFDLASRRFYIFNWVLYPQDLIYLTGLLLISALSLFLFTAIAGRLWCGYACPQTVYTEMFMWIERKIEGDRINRMRMDKAPWGVQKIAKKGLKHLAWIALGLWTGFTFVGYFTPIRVLSTEVWSFALGPWESFWILFYGFATYGNAGWMREQVCKYMCPYARFQSAMFDRDTLIVTYDFARGEDRGSRPRHDCAAQYHAKGLGDCIDCGLCVQVCPTGIDIRKGLQYECISCSACIDVCNGVMDKMRYPRGLIRNSTENAMSQQLTRSEVLMRVFRPRVLVYAGVLAIVSVGMVWGLWTRADFKVDVHRDRGSAAGQVGYGAIENVYRLQIMNATESPQTYFVAIDGMPGATVAPSRTFQVDSAGSRWVALRVQSPPGHPSGTHPIRFVVEQVGSLNQQVIEKSVFFVPR